MGGGRDGEHISHAACAAAGTAPQMLRVLRWKGTTRAMAHTQARTAVSKAVNSLLPPDPEPQLPWGHPRVQAVGCGWGDHWPSYRSPLTPHHLILPPPQKTGSFFPPSLRGAVHFSSRPQVGGCPGDQGGCRLTLTLETDPLSCSRHRHPLIPLDQTCFSEVLHRSLALGQNLPTRTHLK